MKRNNQAEVMRTVATMLVVLTTLALFAGLVFMERVNFTTTHDSLSAIFGAGKDWVLLLSIAVVILDIATLVRVLTPETDVRKEPIAIQVLLGVWATVNMFDAMLNWYFAQLEMESSAVRAPAALADFMWVFPVVAAVIIWGLQVGLLYFFAKMLEAAMKKAGLQVSTPAKAATRISGIGGIGGLGGGMRLPSSPVSSVNQGKSNGGKPPKAKSGYIPKYSPKNTGVYNGRPAGQFPPAGVSSGFKLPFLEDDED